MHLISVVRGLTQFKYSG